MNPNLVTAALRPFSMSEPVYKVLRKINMEIQPKDNDRSLPELRRRNLIYLEDLLGYRLTIAGRYMYEAATVSIEEASEIQPSKLAAAAEVFSITQLAAMALILAIVSLAPSIEKLLDVPVDIVNTISEGKRKNATIHAKENQHEQQGNSNFRGRAPGTPGGTGVRGQQYQELGRWQVAGQS